MVPLFAFVFGKVFLEVFLGRRFWWRFLGKYLEVLGKQNVCKNTIKTIRNLSSLALECPKGNEEKLVGQRKERLGKKKESPLTKKTNISGVLIITRHHQVAF